MKKVCAATAIFFASCALCLSAEVGESQAYRWGINGIFCNKLWQVQKGFSEAKGGISVEDSLASLNEKGQECTNATHIKYVFSRVTLLNTEDQLNGKPVYFYRGELSGVKTQDGKVSEFQGGPAVVYFMSFVPFNVADKKARA